MGSTTISMGIKYTNIIKKECPMCGASIKKTEKLYYLYPKGKKYTYECRTRVDDDEGYFSNGKTRSVRVNVSNTCAKPFIEKRHGIPFQ